MQIACPSAEIQKAASRTPHFTPRKDNSLKSIQPLGLEVEIVMDALPGFAYPAQERWQG